jgi:hypothetical protein
MTLKNKQAAITPKSPDYWRIDPKKRALLLVPGGNTMSAACWHRVGARGRMTACGGCYARALEALSEIGRAPSRAAGIVRAVTTAIRHDNPALAPPTTREEE